jgi:hypothetical protein
MIIGKKDLPRFKSPSSFNIYNSGEAEGKCGHWGELDRFGYCLNDDCRHDRLVRSLVNGTARKLPNGTLVWAVE